MKKKEKHVTEEFVLGKKIRDVQINERQHFLLFVSMILLFNALLLASVWFVLIYLNNWYNWTICIIMLAVSFGLSFKAYRDTKTFHKCELYDNALVITSIWFNIQLPLKDVYEMRVKESGLDKMFKIDTKSLEIRIMNHNRKKLTLHFIEENAVKLKQEITILIDKYSNRTMKKQVLETGKSKNTKSKKDAK